MSHYVCYCGHWKEQHGDNFGACFYCLDCEYYDEIDEGGDEEPEG